ncbi:serine protease [Lentzea sp. NPDC004782]|uniref:S1 family peptidase n=1 Tax=Lentzea sp. NPDC004782 TaxID=3154458 RepID=UPI0033B20AFA
MLLRGGIAAVLLALTAAGTAVADPSAQVVGGTRASIEDNPFAVYLAPTSDTRLPFCTGVVVAPDKILTAAHCVDEGVTGPKPIPLDKRVVVAGRENVHSVDEGVVAKLTRIVINPKYDGISFDSAVLTLDRSLKQKPIRMAGTADRHLYAPGKSATVMGWGAVKEGGSTNGYLMKASIPVLDDETCRAYWGKDDEGNDFYENRSMMCAAVMKGGIDACNGDSGGPFVAGGKLIGLVSKGDGCARPNTPAIYARVDAINSWVAKEISH